MAAGAPRRPETEPWLVEFFAQMLWADERAKGPGMPLWIDGAEWAHDEYRDHAEQLVWSCLHGEGQLV